MHTGKVKFFNEDKGFGFITDDQTKKDIFVHVSSLKGVRLNADDAVSYEEEEGRKGIVATNVVKINN